MCSYRRFSWGSLSNQKGGSALLRLNLCGWKVLNTNVSESPAATGVPREQSSDAQNVSTCQHPGQLDWKLVTMWCYQSQLQLLFKMLVFFTTSFFNRDQAFSWPGVFSWGLASLTCESSAFRCLGPTPGYRTSFLDIADVFLAYSLESVSGLLCYVWRPFSL